MPFFDWLEDKSNPENNLLKKPSFGGAPMLKILFLTMIITYVVIWFGYPLYAFMFPGGGVAETHLKPIYMGIVFLSGIIVTCTYVICKMLEEIKHDIVKELKSSNKVEQD